MIDVKQILELGFFTQQIPVWQVFLFIAGLVLLLLRSRVKICLLLTYLYTFYLGFMVQWGEQLADNDAIQPFVLYALCGLAIAVFYVATIFTEGETEKPPARWSGFRERRSGRGDRRRHPTLERAVDAGDPNHDRP